MISRVLLRNWKSHGPQGTDLRFEEGTNVIIGINGAGKSSVLEAIYFALYGPQEKEYMKRVLREGAKEGEVLVEFVRKGKTYRVRRRFSENKQIEVELRGAENVITNRPKDVNEKIRDILGMDAKVFKEAIYARQNEIAYLLMDASPAERKKLMDSIVELSQFNTARDAVNSLKNSIRAWLRGFQEDVVRRRIEEHEKTHKGLEKELRGIVEAIGRLREEKSQKEAEMERVKGELSKIEPKLTELEDLRKRHGIEKGKLTAWETRYRELVDRYGEPEGNEEELKKALEEELREVRSAEKEISALLARKTSLEQQMARLEKELSSIAVEEVEKSSEELEKELDEIEARVSAIEKELEEKMSELSRIEREISSKKAVIEERKRKAQEMREVRERINALLKKHGDIRKKLTEKRKELERILKEVAELESRAKTEEELADTIKGRDVCPVCETKLGDRAREVERKHRKRSEELKKQAEELRELVERTRKEIKELEEAYAEFERNAPLMEGFDRIVEEIEKLEDEVNSSKKTAEELRKKIEELSKERDVWKQKEKELRERYTKVREAEQRLKRAREAEEQLKLLKKELEATVRSLQELREKIAGKNAEEMEKKMEILRGRIDALQLAESIQKLVPVVEELERKISEMEPLEKKYIEMREKLAELERRVSEIAKEIEGKEAEARRIESEMKRIETEIKESEKLLETASRKRELLGLLEKFVTVIDRTQEAVRNDRVRAINKALNAIWRRLYMRGDLPEIRLRPTEKDYVLEVKRISGKWVPVNTLSGGEFYDAALALRIAISAIKGRDLGLLILDEPTHNLDVEAVRALADLLNQLTDPEKGLFRQVIVITHDETLQEAANGKLYIFERNKGKNGVTIVREGGGTG